MSKSIKAIAIMGVTCMVMMVIASLMLIESAPGLKQSDRLAGEIRMRFNMENVSIAQLPTARGHTYRITCRSHRELDRKQIEAIGSYVWQNYPHFRPPAAVVVVYRQQVSSGCTGHEVVSEENIAPPVSVWKKY